MISPVTEKVLMTFPEATSQDMDRAVAAAREAFDNDPWPRMSTQERGYAIARRVRSGSVTVNGLVVDIKMPFGGFKQSGLGREGGIEGLDPYFELKAIHFA